MAPDEKQILIERAQVLLAENLRALAKLLAIASEPLQSSNLPRQVRRIHDDIEGPVNDIRERTAVTKDGIMDLFSSGGAGGEGLSKGGDCSEDLGEALAIVLAQERLAIFVVENVSPPWRSFHVWIADTVAERLEKVSSGQHPCTSRKEARDILLLCNRMLLYAVAGGASFKDAKRNVRRCLSQLEQGHPDAASWLAAEATHLSYPVTWSFETTWTGLLTSATIPPHPTRMNDLYCR